MQLRQRKSERAAVSKQQSATRNAARRIAAAADAPTAPLAATPLPAAAPADVAELTAPAAPPRKKRKAPQDIGIPELLLGQGLPTAEAVEAVDRLALRAAGFTPDTLQAACEFLARADPKLAPLIEQHGPPERLLAKQGSNFATLAKAIVFQQLATGAAATIYGRVLAACGGGDTLSPAAALVASTDSLRAAGLSERKVSYIRDLAEHFADGRLSDAKIADMDEAALEEALTAVRGIGVWTCHMHAMFHLGSPDVLPVGDLGVRKGMQQLYGLKELPSPAAMEKLSEKWRPFRSLGCYYMWRLLAVVGDQLSQRNALEWDDGDLLRCAAHLTMAGGVAARQLAKHLYLRLSPNYGKPLPRGLHLEHCTLPELREALQEWGLPWAKGKKEELVQRLLDQVQDSMVDAAGQRPRHCLVSAATRAELTHWSRRLASAGKAKELFDLNPGDLHGLPMYDDHLGHKHYRMEDLKARARAVHGSWEAIRRKKEAAVSDDDRLKAILYAQRAKRLDEVTRELETRGVPPVKAAELMDEARVGNWPASDVVWGAKCEVPISEAATWVQLMAWLEQGPCASLYEAALAEAGQVELPAAMPFYQAHTVRREHAADSALAQWVSGLSGGLAAVAASGAPAALLPRLYKLWQQQASGKGAPCNLTTTTVCKEDSANTGAFPSSSPSPSLSPTESPAPTSTINTTETAYLSPKPISNTPANTSSPSPYQSPYYPPSTPSGADPCAYSEDPCCPRSGSFTECVLESSAEQACSFYGSSGSGACQTAWDSGCYRMSDEASCANMEGSGCSWVPFSSGSGPSPSPNPVPSVDLPPWKIWDVPQVPSEYFSTNTTDKWWGQEDTSGHGPFDLLTPPLADALVRADASTIVCHALSDLLRAGAANLTSACESTFCGAHLPAFNALADVLEEAVGIRLPVDACEACILGVEDGLPQLPFDAAAIITPALAAAFSDVCPPLLDGLLWTARHYDFLPRFCETFVNDSQECVTFLTSALADKCCLSPIELMHPDAPDTCANHTTADTACAHSIECITDSDPCNAFVSQTTCELSSACLWRTYSDPSYPGWCMSTRDTCSDFNNDPDACDSAPSCRTVPRCARSPCDPTDACCLTQSAAECRATPGCAVTGWCSMTTSECWYTNSREACEARQECAWESNETAAGWCSVADNPCQPHHSSPLGCAGVTDSRGSALCKFQPACYDACQSCSRCIEGVAEFSASALPALEGNAATLAAAIRDFCAQSGGDSWTCYTIFATVSMHPEAAARPAALCKAAHQCSDECVDSLDLALCSNTGFSGGAIKAAAPSRPGVCQTSAACGTAQMCDTSACAKLTQCDPLTGMDLHSCGGTCASTCELQRDYLARLNSGTCQSDADCIGADETCAAIASRACRRSTCEGGTGVVTTTSCTGFCTSGSAPSLVSAQLSDDGRRITLRFTAAVRASSSAPSNIFDNATATSLGRLSTVYSEWTDDGIDLLIYLDYSANVALGQPLTMAASPAIVSHLEGRTVQAGSVPLQAPASTQPPVALLSGPTSLGSGCAGGTTSDVVFDASRSPFTAGRPVAFSWAVTAATGGRAALDALAAAATTNGVSRLVLPAATVAALPAGNYALSLTVTSWLGGTSTAELSFTKLAAALPVVAVVGGASQTFQVANGLRAQTVIDLASVCSGKRVTYFWEETTGLLPAGSFAANRSTLAVKGPVPTVTAGDVLSFSLTVAFEGAGSASTQLSLTAQQSAVMAVLSGPRGDVLDTRDLVFGSASSLDPDDAANTRTPFSFSWDCTAFDAITQASAPCFAGVATSPDMTATQLRVPAGLLPASATITYSISLTARKGSRSDSDTVTVRVLEGAAPVGTLARFCPGAAGCRSKAHLASEPLRLLFTVDDPSLLPGTTFQWESADVALPATGRQSLVIQPYTADGTPSFAGHTVMINVTATADGKSARASISVPIARRPSCTAATSCLSVSPASGAADTTSFMASAAGFAADSALTYDFGEQDVATGRRSFHVRASATASHTFAPRTLPVGTHTLFACAKDEAGAQACATAEVTVEAAAAAVTAADISSLGAALTTASASGSTDALMSAVRQLSAAAVASRDDEAAAAAAATQAASAMDALQSALSGSGATPEESLGMASAAESLLSSAPTPALAQGALNVAAAALEALAGSTVEADELHSLINIAAAGPVLVAAQPAGSARRLLMESTDPAAALAALASTYHIVGAAQAALLRSMGLGEEATAGTGALLASAALVDPAALGVDSAHAIGDTGAAVTLLAGLRDLLPETPAAIDLLLSHHADASLLLSAVTASAAKVPAASLASGRALLAVAPDVEGALSTSVVSGYVNFTSSLDGAGTLPGHAVAVALPLTDAFDPLKVQGYWRSDAVTLSSAADGTARCTLSNVNNQMVVVVQYDLAEGASPSPPAPDAPAEDAVEVTVPVLSFTARVTSYIPANFTASVQEQYIAAIKGAVPTVGVLVTLTNIRAGSVIVDTAVTFLVSNSATAPADALEHVLSTNPAAVLPATMWGDVTIDALARTTETITVSASLLTAPVYEPTSRHSVLIGALVGAIGGAVLLAAAIVAVVKCRRAKLGKQGSLESEMPSDDCQCCGTVLGGSRAPPDARKPAQQEQCPASSDGPQHDAPPVLSAADVALLEAASLGDETALAAALAAGAGLEAADASGEMALCRAAARGHLACLQALLSAGATLQACDSHGHDALHWAAACGRQDCLLALLAAGADKEARDANGLTTLAIAAGKNQVGCLAALADAGASLAATCWLGNTPAHIAACNGSLPALRYLHQRGGPACLAARNHKGQTALDVAVVYRQRAAERLLAQLERRGRGQLGVASPAGSRGPPHPLGDEPEAAEAAADAAAAELLAAEEEQSARQAAKVAAKAARRQRQKERRVAGSATLDEDLLSELCCPITQEPMESPVLAADGETYEQAAIQAWIARQQAAGQVPCSPLTNLPLAHTRLAPNRVVGRLIAGLTQAGLLS
ncbi:putative DNA-3-methyladenine glycosylase 2 [Micractinium conductrix]|uniref:DNA-3-methyladenine glycosylase 2 n=1 Tax=Micractinium conductrix TaxID=554055 RepID=A0A2P6VAH7_9CHLO|nr:putative DNA-3-methyladenine glycosylase 2 [Micractinium conductrix]|eukprot:PSC71100.1 putative DNA-3-methyladenine glycosylase 2 [Micractinium conductrix]